MGTLRCWSTCAAIRASEWYDSYEIAGARLCTLNYQTMARFDLPRSTIESVMPCWLSGGWPDRFRHGGPRRNLRSRFFLLKHDTHLVQSPPGALSLRTALMCHTKHM